MSLAKFYSTIPLDRSTVSVLATIYFIPSHDCIIAIIEPIVKFWFDSELLSGVIVNRIIIYSFPKSN